MITAGLQPITPCYDLNSELLNLKGDLDDIQAKDTFSKFLLHNAHHFTWQLLTDMKLFPYESILLKSWLIKNFSMNVISRGGSKSFMLAVFAALYSVINPGSRIVVCSSGFRRSRSVLEQVDKFLKSKGADLLRECFPMELRRRNDEYRIDINDGFIVALPLTSSSTLRGQRADVVEFDEGLLCPEDVWNEQIKPFLVAKSGIQEVLRLREIEDFLIQKGLLKEENREFIQTTKKIIVCSSASYKFDFLYKWFQDWVNIILGIKKDRELTGSYFVAQMGYESLPTDLIDMAIINEAKNSSMSESTFQREYGAIFTDDSSGFFSAKKMQECTVSPGELPCAEIKGDLNASYIISIDTSWSESKTSDNFSIAVLKLDYVNKLTTLIHPYAKAGRSFKEHAVYFFYLLTHFNVVAIIVDRSGGGLKFIEFCNEFSLFKENKIKLNKWDCDFDNENMAEALKEAKKTYNITEKKIVYGQTFTEDTVGKLNDVLQFYIDRKRVWFASGLASHDKIYEKIKKDIPQFLFESSKNKERALEDFIDDVDDTITLTKNEAALIEVSISPLGKRRFELPQHLRRSESQHRARRDSYTALLMGVWMAKCLFDMSEIKQEQASVEPMFLA